MSAAWYEVWGNDGHSVPYILILRPNANGFEILDPAGGNKTAFQSSTYEDAKMWLLEDEFEFVGRKEVDE